MSLPNRIANHTGPRFEKRVILNEIPSENLIIQRIFAKLLYELMTRCVSPRWFRTLAEPLGERDVIAPLSIRRERIRGICVDHPTRLPLFLSSGNFRTEEPELGCWLLSAIVQSFKIRRLFITAE